MKAKSVVKGRIAAFFFLTSIASASAIGVGLALTLPTAASAQASVSGDSQLQADVSKALNKKQFQNVTAVVKNGMVTLQGTVAVYADKEDADRRAHHRKGVLGVENMIEVAAGETDDTTLRNKLAEKLTYDRVGYGTTAFNSITIGVQKGVVTLGGVAYGPVDKDSAVSLVANYPGVRDIVDNIEVAPLSPNDDRIRMAAFRSIYGYPSLNKYAIDPAKPIRITVVNGNITLTGVVDSKADSDIANIRANSVPGAFKVTNELQVARDRPEKK